MLPEPPQARRLSIEHRARSVPNRRPFVGALLFSVVFYLSLVATVGSLFAVILLATKASAIAFGVCIGINVFTWLISYLKRRGASCPLCKGTPYVDTGAHKHIKAERLFPLNYGTSNLLRSLFVQRFRCPYCGTPFDMLKKVDRQLRSGAHR
ncbi:MAG: hypothetical protein HKN82_03045 [Akkermansiaceae bacterium]|nr:hypothetical protein [Akkermansiaceae bacterium]